MKVTLFAVLALTTGAVQAQDAVFVDIAPCMALTRNAERYACYDRLEAAVREGQEQPPSPAVPPMSPQVPESASSAPPALEQTPSVADFGTRSPGTAEVLTTQDGKQELYDTIAALREREPGRLLITLASGQIWYQTNSSRTRLREGMAVKIFPSPFGGSWRLAGTEDSSTGFIQVRRVE